MARAGVTTPDERREPRTPATRRATTSPWLRAALVAAALALLALFLAYAEASFNGYRVQLTTLVAINAIVAVSLTMASGFTGVFSLG